MIKKMVAAFAAILMVFALSSCSSDGLSDPAFRTLRYEGGDTGGSKFKECVSEGEKLVSNDTFYSYPKTQRESIWDSSNFEKGSKSADFPDLVVTDKDGRLVHVKMKISFMLNTSCDKVEANGKTYKGGTIQAFHELIGKTRGADFDTSESGSKSYGNGWLWVMTNYISTPAENFVSKAIRPQSVEDLFNDTRKQEAIQDSLLESLPKLVNDVMETDLQFFENFTVVIYKVTPDDEYLNLIKERENAQIKAETAKRNAVARVAEAEANAKVAEAEASVKRAEISGYGGFNNYKCIYLADHGLNCAQPQYVVGGAK